MYRPLRSQRAKAIPRRANFFVFLILASALTILFTLSLPAPRAYAGSYVVTTCADSGAVEMRAPVEIETIWRDGAALTNASSVVYKVTFSGPVTGLSAGNFSLKSYGLSGTSISDVSGNGAAWVVTVDTGRGDGYLRLDMVNANGLSGPVSGLPFIRGDGYTLDKTMPTVTINQASGQADPTNAAPIRFDVTFSENVFGFDASDIALSGTAGATTAIVSGGHINYTVEVSGMTGDGTVIASINAGAASDQAGNASAASTSTDNTVEYDTTAPAVVLSSAAPNPTNEPFAVAVSFSEDVTGFEAADITITNGTLSSFSGSGTSYTFTVTPGADGLVTIDIPAGVAHDAAGNGNTVATQLTRSYDSTPPTVTLSTAAANPINAAFAVSVTFSEPVTGFSASSIALINGTVSSFSGSGTSYGFTVTPGADGEVTVMVSPGAVSDAAGNTNLAVIPLTRTFDATAPSVTLSSAAPDPTNAPIAVTATFSEPVTGFDASDVTVTNGTLSGFTGSGAGYSFTVVPGADGLVTVGIAPGVAVDAAGNANTAAAELRRLFDATAPSVTLSSTAPDPTNAPFSVGVTFGQDVSDFEASDVTITNGTLSDFAGSGTSYGFTVTPGADGLVTVELAAGVAHDAAGNPNPAVQLTRTYDITASTVTVEQSAAQADPTTTAPILFTVTFSEDVTGFDDSDILLGGTAGATTATVSGGPTVYSVEVSGMTAFGTVTAEVPAGAAIDAAGNVSLASTSADNAVTYSDSNAPGVLVDPVALALLENGPAEFYTVRLTSQPLVGETVSVDVAPSSPDASASPAALSFDQTNWNLPQTVSVSAVDNTLADGTRTVSIAHTVASNDPSTPYGAGTVTAPSVDLTLQDDDTPGLIIAETNGSTAVTEGSGADSYTVALTMQPAAGDTVTVTLAFDATWLAVTPVSLTFDTSTWDTPQTVLVTAVDNLTVGDGPTTVRITHRASSAIASPYEGLTAELIVHLADNDILFVGDPVPLCADFDGATSAVVRATVPPGAVTNGGVYCHTLVEDGSYVKDATAASIGHPEMVSGVWQAVDVYGMAGPHSYTQFNGSVEVCLKGAGRLLFLDASTQPRSLSALSVREASGYTCAILPGAGTVSLVQGVAPSGSGSPAADPAPPHNGGSAAFGECAVTTRAILNLREAPSADAAITALVPFDVSLTAFERAHGWFYVDYLGLRGWLSADHVTPRGGCGQ